MKCPKCKTENPETQRFCGDCGTQLTPISALSALEKGVAARSVLMPYLKVDSLLDPLRDDPRFKALLKKVGFDTE